MSVIAYNPGGRKGLPFNIMIGMKLREDDIKQESDEPQGESPEGSGTYYYDDSTGYELYEPTTSLDEEEPQGEEATAAEAE